VMEVKETVQRTVTVRLVAPPAPMDNAGEQTDGHEGDHRG